MHHNITIRPTGQLKCDGTHAETRFRLSAKRRSQFKSAGASAQSTTGSRGVRISGSNAGYTMFQGSGKGTGYSLHSPVSPSLPCVTMCHHISNGLYLMLMLPKILIQHYSNYFSPFFCLESRHSEKPVKTAKAANTVLNYTNSVCVLVGG